LIGKPFRSGRPVPPKGYGARPFFIPQDYQFSSQSLLLSLSFYPFLCGLPFCMPLLTLSGASIPSPSEPAGLPSPPKTWFCRFGTSLALFPPFWSLFCFAVDFFFQAALVRTFATPFFFARICQKSCALGLLSPFRSVFSFRRASRFLINVRSRFGGKSKIDVVSFEPAYVKVTITPSLPSSP